MKKVVVLLVFALFAHDSCAQCAMCRTTLQNNVSQGEIGIAAGINFGILYLLVIPYIAIALIGYFWYRSSKRNENQRHTGLA